MCFAQNMCITLYKCILPSTTVLYQCLLPSTIVLYKCLLPSTNLLDYTKFYCMKLKTANFLAHVY